MCVLMTRESISPMSQLAARRCLGALRCMEIGHIRYSRIAMRKRVSVLAGKRMAGGQPFVSGNLLTTCAGVTRLLDQSFQCGKRYGISEPSPRRPGPSLPDRNAALHRV